MQQVLAMVMGGGMGAIALFGSLYLFGTSKVRKAAVFPNEQLENEFAVLLRNGVVFDSTNAAEAVLNKAPMLGMDWAELRDVLVRRFQGLPETPPDNACKYVSNDGLGVTLNLEPKGNFHRITVSASSLSFDEQQEHARNKQSIADVQSVMNAAPMPMWKTDFEQRVVWSNMAFDRLVQISDHKEKANPFDIAQQPTNGSRTLRASLQMSDGGQRWYEVTTRAEGDGELHFATNIDSLIDAEMAQRNFVQTLTKTFAHLPIGLAVFDRDRRLVLFNPALVDLTRLPVDFLSARPNLFSFFDHMRENRMMPEPKNYTTWRDQLGDVISAAHDDRYCETWTLPSGLTYKITGRPHPDGAVAFLLEDISAEISLTRRFRSELELTQSVIDCFTDAVAVFSQLGVLTFSNAAYRKMWQCDPDSAFAEVTIVDAVGDWQRACQPSPIWPELRDFVLTLRDRATWDSELLTRHGKRLLCTVEPVSAGATMVRFSSQEANQLTHAVPEGAEG